MFLIVVTYVFILIEIPFTLVQHASFLHLLSLHRIVRANIFSSFLHKGDLEETCHLCSTTIYVLSIFLYNCTTSKQLI